MRAYFETSALVKVLLDEEDRREAQRLWTECQASFTSSITYAEGRAALAAARRASRLSAARLSLARAGLEAAFRQMHVIHAAEGVCRIAGDVAEERGLAGADAIHLASAMTRSDDAIVVVTWDRALARAATAAGLATAGVRL